MKVITLVALFFLPETFISVGHTFLAITPFLDRTIMIHPVGLC